MKLAAPRLLRAAFVAVTSAALATPLVAQGRAPGWVGISFEVRTSGDASDRSATVVITDVREGSPAEEAGLEAGDVLLSINDVRGPDELGTLLGRLQLRAGDPVRIQVERDGWRREMHLRAAARPDDMSVTSTFTFSFEPDSVVETMVRAMDSLRSRLARTHNVSVHVSAAPERSRVAVLTPIEGEAHTVRAPFEFFVFRGEAHDSLRREMEALNLTIAALRASEERRLDELRRTPALDGSIRAVDEDEELEALRAAQRDASRRSMQLRAAMADAARASAGFEYSEDRAPVRAPWAPAAAHEEEFRPLTPYLLGRNRVAGAEVVDLRPELAAYFGVEGGILVVDVPDRTPADVAGIRPGDVITRLDRTPVRSVEELRLGVSRGGPALPVTLIRQGASVQVLLRR